MKLPNAERAFVDIRKLRDYQSKRRFPAADNVLCFEAESDDAMKKKTIKLLDTVALLHDIPERKLRAGEVGTVVEILGGAYEVEFCDNDGQSYAELALRGDQILPLHTAGKSLKLSLVEA